MQPNLGAVLGEMLKKVDARKTNTTELETSPKIEGKIPTAPACSNNLQDDNKDEGPSSNIFTSDRTVSSQEDKASFEGKDMLKAPIRSDDQFKIHQELAISPTSFDAKFPNPVDQEISSKSKQTQPGDGLATSKHVAQLTKMADGATPPDFLQNIHPGDGEYDDAQTQISGYKPTQATPPASSSELETRGSIESEDSAESSALSESGQVYQKPTTPSRRSKDLMIRQRARIRRQRLSNRFNVNNGSEIGCDSKPTPSAPAPVLISQEQASLNENSQSNGGNQISHEQKQKQNSNGNYSGGSTSNATSDGRHLHGSKLRRHRDRLLRERHLRTPSGT